MIFSNDDKKRIGSNIRHIRRALGFSNTFKFCQFFRNGISEDTLKKIESGRYDVKEETIRLFASLVPFFDYSTIVYDDLSDLEPDSFLIEPKDFLEAIQDPGGMEPYIERFSSIFPLFTSEDAKQSMFFCEAYDMCMNKVINLSFGSDDIENIVKTFLDHKENREFPETYANVLSVLGYYYWSVISNPLSEEECLELFKEKDLSSLSKKFYTKTNTDDGQKNIIERRNALNADCVPLVDECIKKLADYNDFKNYCDYYFAIRYIFGMMYSEEVNLSIDEMNSFGLSMMNSLKKSGNKYANNFLN